jgi:hypothetical protein
VTITLPSPTWTPDDDDPEDDLEVVDPDLYPDPIPYDWSNQCPQLATH